MSDLSIVTAWRREDSQQGADAKAYWEKLGLVPAEERALAYSEGTLVGASTAELIVLPGLRQRFALCRASG
jgi:hypothetical protein